jgi:REP element-mobilizing transposase RayT
MSKPKPLQYEAYYHIYNRGNNGETIFRHKENYLYFLKLYLHHFYLMVETFAYCLLPNHFHFVVWIRSRAEIEALAAKTLRVSQISGRGSSGQTLRVSAVPTPSQAFGNLCNAYAKAVNNRYGRTGSLFENPFGRIPVTTDAYFYNLITYVHRNPQKHGIVDDFRNWPYSSYDAILHDKPTRVCKTAVLEWYGDLKQFEEAHEIAPEELPLQKWLGDIE